MVECLLWLQVEVREVRKVCVYFANVNRGILDVNWMDSRIASQSKKEIYYSLYAQKPRAGLG